MAREWEYIWKGPVLVNSEKQNKTATDFFSMINRAQRQRMAREDPYVFYQQQTSVHRHKNMKTDSAN